MKYFLYCLGFISLFSTPVGAQDLFLTVSKPSQYLAALNDLSIAIANQDYTLIKIQPVDSGLRQKSYEVGNYKVLFFGNNEQVNKLLSISPEASVILPLKIILYQNNDSVIASAPNLQMWKGVFGDALDAMIDQWQDDIAKILKEFESYPENSHQQMMAGN